MQVDTTLDRSRGGLGLGLAMSKELVELHGGTISASSDGLGKGAEFVISLPVDDYASEESPQDVPSKNTLSQAKGAYYR